MIINLNNLRLHHIENKHSFYRKIDFMKNFCESLKELLILKNNSVKKNSIKMLQNVTFVENNLQRSSQKIEITNRLETISIILVNTEAKQKLLVI